MDRKRELVEADDRGWAELHGLIGRLSEEELTRDGYYADWSVKDLLAHIGSWCAEAARMFEQMRMGTFRREHVDVEALNALWYEAWRDKETVVVRSELHAAHARMLAEWSLLPEVTPDADEWFRESSSEHYAEHLPRLDAWVEELHAPVS